MGRIVGARPVEVALLNSLTVNLHLLFASFFRPDGRRRRILADGPLFPSDRHALTSHLAQRGLDPATDLIVIGPRDGEHLVRTEDLEAAIAANAADLALVFLAGVNFATGQALDIERLTAAGHDAGAVVGWDLAHAAGNIELALHDWDVDFAAWCTYKYLNGGPGSVGAIFVHERHARDRSIPRLGGWWGLDPDVRFDPVGPFVPAEGAAGWATSTTSILALAPVAASLAIFDEVGMPALRARSVALTGYLEASLADIPIEIITPRRPGGPRRPALASPRRCRRRSSPGSPNAASWPTSARPTSSGSPRSRSTRPSTRSGASARSSASSSHRQVSAEARP